MFRAVVALNKHELAWAAGFFDAEGSFCFVRFDRRRDRWRARVSLPQAGPTYPETLERFQRAVGGLGRRLERPSRGNLYYWYSDRFETVQVVGALLWRWLGSEKRSQLTSVLRRARSLPAISGAVTGPVETIEDPAWAAGLFDGEGSFCGAASRPPDRYRTISARLPQSNADGAPEALLRLRRILGRGHIRGPRQQRNAWSKLPQYRWEVTNPGDVAAVIEDLSPFLATRKRAQAADALAAYHSTPPRRLRTRIR